MTGAADTLATVILAVIVGYAVWKLADKFINLINWVTRNEPRQ